jgi:hypothetical protein
MIDGPFYVDEAGDAICPGYDVVKMREKEKPNHASQ